MDITLTLLNLIVIIALRILVSGEKIHMDLIRLHSPSAPLIWCKFNIIALNLATIIMIIISAVAAYEQVSA